MGLFANVLAAIAGAAVLGGTGLAAGQSHDRSNPPLPPEGASDTQLAAWKSRYVDDLGYVEAATDARRVLLFDPASLRAEPDGLVIAMFRSENFRPVKEGDKLIRSVRKRVEIDCPGLRYRELTFEGFAHSNLREPVRNVPYKLNWTQPFAKDSGVGRALGMACDHAKKQN